MYLLLFVKEKTEQKNNYGDEQEKQRKLDLLKYQLNEIQEAKLKKDEEEKLAKLKKLLDDGVISQEEFDEAKKKLLGV